MKYTKEQKELLVKALTLMLSEVYRVKWTGGLCFLNHQLYCERAYDKDSIVNDHIYYMVLIYIKNNRVSMFSSWNAFVYSSKGYWWKPGLVEPRKKWLIKHINKLSK